jgi:hypothetical protein
MHRNGNKIGGKQNKMEKNRTQLKNAQNNKIKNEADSV